MCRFARSAGLSILGKSFATPKAMPECERRVTINPRSSEARAESRAIGSPCADRSSAVRVKPH
jgi:hypothetical protein